MAMDSTAKHCNQELMFSQSETLESMLNVCTKSNQAKTKPKPCDQQALKCPRCDSNNTKFCYYNNYSLTQPRYFCKSCRRYWTKGGTLRNVPVGGGCRKNKRSSSSSSSSSKSRISQDHHNQPMITTNPNFPDWINPNIPKISSTDHYNDHHHVIGGGAGIFDALRGTGLFNLETPSRNVCYGLMENSNGSAGGLGHEEEMGLNYINSHTYVGGFDEEYLSGAGAVNFPWQMMASSNGINGHGLLNTPLM